MKKLALIYTLLTLLGMTAAWAQNPYNRVDPTTGRDEYGNMVDPSTLPDNLEDSTEVISLPPKLYMWRLSETLGNQIMMPADTATLNFQNSDLTSGLTGEYNYLGALGSPRLSRIYFNRPQVENERFFIQPFSAFFFGPEGAKFTNSNVPYTNLTYYSAGGRENGDDHFKAYFSLNANKRLAFGFNIDYLYSRGQYQKQANSGFMAGLFGSYTGEKYQAHLVYNAFNMKMNENGGIQDDRHITDAENPEFANLRLTANTIPVRFDGTTASNRNKNFYVYLTHRYRLGIYRDKVEVTGRKGPQTPPAAHQGPAALQDPAAHQRPAAGNPSVVGNPSAADSLSHAVSVPMDTTVTEEFVPVTSFIHTLKVERSRHRFVTSGETAELFPPTYTLSETASNDSTTAFSVKNTFGLALLEGFNKWAKAGLTAYVTHKFSKFQLMNTDMSLSERPAIKMDEQELWVGGELAKRQGKTLHYNVTGEVGLLDAAIGQFKVDADMDLNFRLWRDTVRFVARGHVSNTLPNFYLRHYRSNRLNWDNDLSKEFRTRIEGQLSIDRWHTQLRAGVENIKNYTYLDGSALPMQEGENIQVLSARLKQDFHLGIFHLENEVTWQKTSHDAVLPLPELTTYHNFYIQTTLAKKVLKLQLGAELIYFSKYNAPYYSPVIQQYHLQPESDQVTLGGYPFVNAYVNLHLKRTRIFVLMSHINQGMGNANSFTVPHYPVNPTQWLNIGISWNFYD